MSSNLRHAFRQLAKSPGFTMLAVLTLALGIGATTTIFSVMYGVLLDPFPYLLDESRVVMPQIVDNANARNGFRNVLQLPEFLDYQEQSKVYEDVIAGSFEDVLYSTNDGTEQLRGGLASGNMFSFLGVPALVGRTLTPEDSRPGAPPVFVMGYRMWSSRFNLDPAILGRTFVLDGVPTTLVGIMPQRFSKMNADVYRAVVLDRADPRINQRYFLFQGKLKPGMTLQQAEAEFSVIAQRLAQAYPRNYPPKFTAQVVNWVDWVVGPFRGTLYILAAAVGLLLLIACSNVANMLLAWGTAREKEMAIRAALGASRGRLVRQLLGESLLLALIGAVPGCILAFCGIKALVRFIPQNTIPGETVIQLNLPVLLFSLGLSVVTAVAFGLVPALQTARPDLVEPLKDSRKGGGGSRGGRIRSVLVVAEIALSLVLLAGAGLLMRSFIKLQNADLGFDPERVLAVRLPFSRDQYTTRESRQNLYRELLPRLQALPGVESATVASSLPPFGGARVEIDVPGQTHTERWETIISLCSETYFKTLRLKLLRGRLLTETEVNDRRRVAVVNQSFINRYLGTNDPVGRSVVFRQVPIGPNDQLEDANFEIVGVVADIKNQGPDQPAWAEAFVPFSLTGRFRPGLLIRAAGDPVALTRSVQSEIWTVDRNVAITNTDSLGNFLRQFAYAVPRFSLIVLGAFAGVGLVLVIIGVFSVMAYTVSGQTHEIGIRMALGASRGAVLGMILKKGLLLICLGIGAGLLVTIGVSRALVSQLTNVEPYDPLVLSGVAVLLATAGLAACFFPAHHATQVNPIDALRAE